METIRIPVGAEAIISTSSKGDQSKWRIGDKWIKKNARSYENTAESVASLILQSTTRSPSQYVTYTPCIIEEANGELSEGCYSLDFRGTQQEVTLERLHEANFTTTDSIVNNTRLSTVEKFNAIIEQIHGFTGLDITDGIARMLAFDAFILNEDRHTNNILFLYNPPTKTWELAPIFDNGLSLLSDIKDYPLGKPISVLKRLVRAKPFNSSFSKQLALYKGKPFINKDLLLQNIDNANFEMGRAKDVLLSQLRDPQFNHLIIEGCDIDD
ncbi:hypothetical protein [Sporosarcina limicola]|uniref:HipA-like C-terminal domain-containing protein n=1 Tax=Sporosarcina limicola TaxID=34101 RepID=A0A927MJ05_9BACL|nr:hypothetical protein [Sporosarcina limicola]MBE1555560.1 hypothetical protein [Sporosarcina limicola]